MSGNLEKIKRGGYTWRAQGRDGACFVEFFHARYLGHEDRFPAHKNNSARAVRRVPDYGGSSAAFVKRFALRGLPERMKFLFVSPRSRIEGNMLCLFQEKNIPTVDFLASGEQRVHGVLRDSVVATREARGMVDLYAWLARERAESPPRGKALAQLGELAARIHAADLVHGDLHAGNFMVHPERGSLLVLDLHAVRRVPCPSPGERLANLALLDHSLIEHCSKNERRRVLQAYLHSGGELGMSPKRAFEDMQRRTSAVHRRHVASRARRCLKSSSRFEIIRGAGWTMFLNREYGLSDVLAEAEEPRRFRRELNPRPAGALGVLDLLGDLPRARRRWVQLNQQAVENALDCVPVALIEYKGTGAPGPGRAVILLDPPAGC